MLVTTTAVTAEPILRPAWTIIAGDAPVVAAAIHAGHDVTDEAAEHLALDEHTRRREEDPFCDRFATVTDNCILVHRSRFEVDLNRPRHQAVYRRPADAWGLRVWRDPDGARGIHERALRTYDRFYESVRVFLEGLAEQHGRFVLLDIHTYNHRRGGPNAPPEPQAANPDINLGTGRIDRAHWAGVIDGFLASARGYDFLGRRLDVRENVRFQGGHFPGWVERTFPRVGCALAIEIKKFFMDEWTGKPDIRQATEVRRLIATVAGELGRLMRGS